MCLWYSKYALMAIIISLYIRVCCISWLSYHTHSKVHLSTCHLSTWHCESLDVKKKRGNKVTDTLSILDQMKGILAASLKTALTAAGSTGNPRLKSPERPEVGLGFKNTMGVLHQRVGIVQTTSFASNRVLRGPTRTGRADQPFRGKIFIES